MCLFLQFFKKISSPIALVALFLFTETALADATKCHSISNPIDRVKCYDEVTGRERVTRQTPSEGKQFDVVTKTSKFNDATEVFVQLTSLNRVTDSYRAKQGRITLVFRCFENTTALIINTDDYMSNNYTNNVVEYRLDADKAQKKKFTVSNSGTALGLWTGGSSIPFIKSMFGKESLVLRYTPYNDNIKTAEFNIAGLEEAIKPLRKACGW